MTSSLLVGYRLGCPFVKSCTLDLGYIFQQAGASPWLGTSQGWSGSAKIVPLSHGGHFEFSNFFCKTQNACISKTVLETQKSCLQGFYMSYEQSE